jgi:hypothetical protein
MNNLDKISDIDKLNVSITDLSYEEGLTEIINELKKIHISTFSMNDNGRLVGHEQMLEKVINYLERCL